MPSFGVGTDAPRCNVAPQKEASEVFFAATKLFQNKDTHLRRMVYLCIRDVCPSADEVIIVTSSLMKDMNSKVDLYRSNSIRVLCSIIDSQLLAQVRPLLLLCSLPGAGMASAVHNLGETAGRH